MKREGLRPFCTKPRERSACSRLSVMMNQAGGPSSIRYEAVRKESFSSSVQYEESSKLEFVRPDKVTRWRACPRPSSTWNQVGGTISVRYKVARKEGFYSSVWYEDSCKEDYVLPVRSRAKGEHVLFCTVRGIKQAGLRPSGMKSQERRACPRPSGTRNQVGRTSSVRYEVARKWCLSSSIRYDESSMWSIVRPV